MELHEDRANQWLLDTGENGNLPNLTAEEKRLFAILFKQADTKGDGIVTGEVAITLFFKTKLSENTLGEVRSLRVNFKLWRS